MMEKFNHRSGDRNDGIFAMILTSVESIIFKDSVENLRNTSPSLWTSHNIGNPSPAGGGQEGALIEFLISHPTPADFRYKERNPSPSYPPPAGEGFSSLKNLVECLKGAIHNSKKHVPPLFFFLLLFRSAFAAGPDYPQTRVEIIHEFHHGISVQDPYRWLEDGESKEVQAWVSNQNKIAQSHLSSIRGREKLLSRLRSLYYVDSVSIPEKRGDRLFYTRQHPAKEKPVLYWRDRGDREENLLLDPNQKNWDAQSAIGHWAPSPDGNFIAYSVSKNNADNSVLHVFDIQTGEERSEERLPWAEFADLSWSSDSLGFYYTRLSTDSAVPEEDRVAHMDVRYHKLGSSPTGDRSVFPATGDPKIFLTPQTSPDGRWLFMLQSNGWTSTNVYFKDNESRNAEFQSLFRSTFSKAAVLAHEDFFYLYTNFNAPQFQVLRASSLDAPKFNWVKIVPERSQSTIHSMKIIGRHLVLTVLEKASSKIEIRALDGRLVHTVPLPTIGSVHSVSGEEDSNDLYYEFESFTIPPRVYWTSVLSGETKVWGETKLDIDAPLYKIDQVFYPSQDGTVISMFVINRKDAPVDGSVPFLLEGYGGFSVSLLPHFKEYLYPWLEAGGGIAMPHLRGGGEYGEEWHTAGMLTKRQNVIDDFIAAAEYLIDKKRTSADRLAIQGTSNGGLTAAAAITQRPRLFKAAVIKVPLCDMLRYPMFGQGKTWIPEYGSPEDPVHFQTLLSYSPYHNVHDRTAYPSALFISADSDDHVHPMHARKMAAAMQKANSAPNPILLLTVAHSGHKGGAIIKSRVETMADQLLFLMNEVGLKNR